MKIALTGNPNSGKTTMFNALTGSSEKVGNWAGVTVDKKENNLKKNFCPNGETVTVVDLPGAYSMSPFTSEESVTRDYVMKSSPDVIVNIVDATNLSRSLFFTTQILELGIPTVIALNKTDINDKKNNKVDAATLSEKLGCPVIETVSISANGLRDVISAAMESVGKIFTPPYRQDEIDLNDREAVVAADKKRFAFVNKLVSEVETRTVFTRETTVGDKIDALITSKWLGIPIFAAVMFLVFQISQVWLGAWIAEGVTVGKFEIPGLVTLLESFQGYVGGLLDGANPLLYALLVDGVIGGVTAVVGFLPLVMVMYFLIAILEDCGYMSRVAVVLDPIFKRVGLSGRSVIPFVMTVGCAVPGVMASRTVRDERERRATAMLAPFMPCGAKIPVISLFAGAFFDNAGWVSTVMYLSGILLIFLSALLINKITAYKARKSYFIIELPEYKLPSLKGALLAMISRGKEYVIKAATIILLCNTAVHVMQSFTWTFKVAENAESSILATVAIPFAYLLVPVVGVLSWQLAAAAVTGFIAKENVVGTLAVCYAATNFISDAGVSDGASGLMTGIGTSGEVIAITSIAALAYLMFNLYSPPCFAAIGAMRSELKSTKWLIGGIALQLGVGFTVSYLVYTIGTLIIAPASLRVVPALIGAAAIVLAGIFVMILCVRSSRKASEEKKAKESARRETVKI